MKVALAVGGGFCVAWWVGLFAPGGIALSLILRVLRRKHVLLAVGNPVENFLSQKSILLS